MNRRSIILCTTLAVLLLGGICWLFSSLFFSESGDAVGTDRLAEGVEAVPSDAIFFLEASSLQEIKMMTDEGSTLGRLFECIPSAASEWEAVLSMHYSSKNAVSPLLVLSIPDGENVEAFMSSIMKECGGVVDKRYGSVTVHKAAVPDVSLAVCGNFLIASPSLVILEASLRHMDNGSSIKEEPLYNRITGVTSDRGIMHMNFSNIGKLFSGAVASGYVKYASAFSSFADWGAFGLADGDCPTVFEGRVMSVRSGEKYSDVLLSQRGRRPEAWSVAPYSSPYVLALPITSYEDYIRSYTAFVAADGRRNKYEVANAMIARDSSVGIAPAAFVESLKLSEVAVFALDADGGRKVLALKCGNPGALGNSSDTVCAYRFKGCVPALLGSIFAPSSEESYCILDDGWVLVGGREEITSLMKSWRAGTYFSMSDYLAQTPAYGELRELSCLSLIVNAGRYSGTLSGYLKESYSNSLMEILGGHNFEFIAVNLHKVGDAMGIRVAFYSEDLASLPQPANAGNGTSRTVVEDIPVEIPDGPFAVKNFIDGSTNWLEQLDNNDLRLLGASRNPIWTVKFSEPVCGTVRQIDYLKNNKLQMLFGAGDKVWLLDRLGRKVGRFPISLGKDILLGPDVYDFDGDRNYTMMVLHKDNTLMQYDIDGKQIPGWHPVTLGEKVIALPECIKVGDGVYWAVRTSYQALLYDAHGTICADFSRKYKLRKDTGFEPVSSHEVAVTTADGRMMILDLDNGSFRKK